MKILIAFLLLASVAYGQYPTLYKASPQRPIMPGQPSMTGGSSLFIGGARGFYPPNPFGNQSMLPPNPPSPYYVAPSGQEYLNHIYRRDRMIYGGMMIR